jgi:hypothetical protein
MVKQHIQVKKTECQTCKITNNQLFNLIINKKNLIVLIKFIKNIIKILVISKFINLNIHLKH